MGSRHQLFVIARIHGRYRRLAAVHSQIHSGETALRRCLSLLKIFTAASNRVPIQQELIAARRCDVDFWKPKKRGHTAPSPDTYGLIVAPFPFITTCLVLGASYDATEGYQRRVHPLPFNMQFDGGDNNDGITILDVTEAQSPRYCFANLEDRMESNGGDSDENNGMIIKAKTPLQANSYLWGYYDKSDQRIQEQFGGLIRDVEAFHLLDTASLKSAWSDEGDIAVAKEQRCVSTQSTARPTRVPSLKDSAIDKVVEVAVGGSEIDQAALSNILQIPGLRTELRARMYQSALHLAPSEATSDILIATLASEAIVDLGCFCRFSSADLCKIISRLQEANNMTHLNLSNHPSNAEADLSRVLSAPSALQSVCLLATPQTSMESVPNIINACGSGGINVYHTELLRAAFRREPELHNSDLTDYIETISSLSGYGTANPVSGIIWVTCSARGVARKPSRSDGKRIDWEKTMARAKNASYLSGKTVEYGNFSLRDVPLSEEKLVSGMTNLVKCFTNSSWSPMPQYVSDMGLTAAKSFAMASSTIPAAAYEVGPLPEALFTASSVAACVFSCPWPTGMPELCPGQWTIVMINEYDYTLDTSGRELDDDPTRIRYALVSPIEPDENISRPHPEYMVLDMETFLRERFRSCADADVKMQTLVEFWETHGKDRLGVSTTGEIHDILAVLPDHIKRAKESKGFEMVYRFHGGRHH